MERRLVARRADRARLLDIVARASGGHVSGVRVCEQRLPMALQALRVRALRAWGGDPSTTDLSLRTCGWDMVHIATSICRSVTLFGFGVSAGGEAGAWAAAPYHYYDAEASRDGTSSHNFTFEHTVYDALEAAGPCGGGEAGEAHPRAVVPCLF